MQIYNLILRILNIIIILIYYNLIFYNLLLLIFFCNIYLNKTIPLIHKFQKFFKYHMIIKKQTER
jgi:uncharacterized membrane-anchored protein YitT (DUF2179 family)